jgi:hypothetical protein
MRVYVLHTVRGTNRKGWKKFCHILDVGGNRVVEALPARECKRLIKKQGWDAIEFDSKNDLVAAILVERAGGTATSRTYEDYPLPES